MLLPLVNRLLPADTRIEALDGLRISQTRGALDILALDWQGHELSLRNVRWQWRLEPSWPPRLRLFELRTDRLELQLASTESTAITRWQALPRPEETEAWPWLKELQLSIGEYDIDTGTGTRLRGNFTSTPALGSGSAGLQLESGPALRWTWQALPQASAWRVDWVASNPIDATGRLQFATPGKLVNWTLDATVPRIAGGGQTAEQLLLQASGEARPFEDGGQLLQADIEFSAKLPSTAVGDLLLHCRAELFADTDLLTQARLSNCSAGDGAHEILFATPLTASTGAGAELQAIDLGAGRIELASISWSAWQIDDLRLDIEAGPLWRPAQQSLILPRVAYALTLTNRELAVDSSLSGTIGSASVDSEGVWQASVDGAIVSLYRDHQLVPLQMQMELHGDSSTIRGEGSVRESSLGTLFTVEAKSELQAATLELLARLNSEEWQWQDGLFTQLLGRDQQLVPLQLSDAMIDLELSLVASAEQLRGVVRGRLENAFGQGNGIGFAGLSVAPFEIPWQDGSLDRRLLLDWQLQAANAGLTATALRGTLAWQDSGWSLRGVHGEILGGAFSIAELSDFSQSGHQGELQFSDIDLAELVALIDMPELTVSGRVGGSVPISWEEQHLVIADGELRNLEAGVIRYLPANGSAAAGGNPQLELTYTALSDLQYQTLEADLNYSQGGDLVVDAKLRGSNPELDQGRPIHLNLHIENNIDSLLRSLRASDRITSWLSRQVENAGD